jgi:hypothetical protein
MRRELAAGTATPVSKTSAHFADDFVDTKDAISQPIEI